MLHDPLLLREPNAPPMRAKRNVAPTAPAAPGQARHPGALTIVAHDLRGPLASLGMLIDLIESHSATGSLDKIASCANRAGTIVDSLEDILNSVLERVQKTGDPLGFTPDAVNMDQIIRASITTHRPAADNKSVNILCHLTEPVRVQGDAQLLSQVIENLVGNAIKHSGVGTNVLCTMRQSGTKAIIDITDTGNGLTRRDLQRAFRPFTRLSSKSVDGPKSWGLGLWLTKLIVEQHGGQISVASPGPGRGTTFRICLPAYT